MCQTFRDCRVEKCKECAAGPSHYSLKRDLYVLTHGKKNQPRGTARICVRIVAKSHVVTYGYPKVSLPVGIHLAVTPV